MVSVIFGLLSLGFAAYATIPFAKGLGWTEEFLFVLKGALPLFAIGLGLLCILIGVVDVLDRKHAKKEALLQKELEEQEKQTTKIQHNTKD